MRILSRSCLLLLAAGLCTGAMAQNVYQWKDANGVTHSSDNPPAGQRYETRRIDTQGQGVAVAAPAAPVESADCTTARRNLQLLAGQGEVQQDTDGDGKPDKALTPEERQGQKGLAEAAVKAYCPPA